MRKLVVLIFISMVFCAYLWAQQDTTKLKPPILLDIEKPPVVVPKERGLEHLELPMIEKREAPIPQESIFTVPELSEVGQSTLPPQEQAQLVVPDLALPESKTVSLSELPVLQSPKLPEVGFLEVKKLNDFKGGLDLVSAKTKIPDNCAIELENAIWNPQGELEKREGYSRCNEPQVDNIREVTVNITAKSYGAAGVATHNQLVCGIFVDGEYYHSQIDTVDTLAWTTYEHTWAQNPQTGSAWLPHQVDQLKIRLKSYKLRNLSYAEITHIWQDVYWANGDSTIRVEVAVDPDLSDGYCTGCESPSPCYDDVFDNDTTWVSQSTPLDTCCGSRLNVYSATRLVGTFSAGHVLDCHFGDSTKYVGEEIDRVSVNYVSKYLDYFSPSESLAVGAVINMGWLIDEVFYPASTDDTLLWWKANGEDLGFAWDTTQVTWTQNPATDEVWTAGEINDAQFRVRSVLIEGEGNIRVTQVYLRVVMGDNKEDTVIVLVDGNGTVSDWSMSGCTAQWECVDEYPDHDSSLTYIHVNNFISPIQDLTVADSLGAELGENPFNFLYRYYQQDGDKYLMAGTDTALYYSNEDSCSFNYLTGTGGVSGRWDGTTFEDMFVGTHEGIEPVAWNGSTFVEIGVSVDSFTFIGWAISFGESTGCSYIDSIEYQFESEETGWETNYWTGYTLGYWARHRNYENPAVTETVFVKDLIAYNTESSIIFYGNTASRLILSDYHAKIYSLFGVDSVWREGTVDSSVRCYFSANNYAHGARLKDSSFVWDSTFSYRDYIFEVVGGKGVGKKCFLHNFGYNLRCGDGTAQWDTAAFIVPMWHADCFDSTTQYRIYAPSIITLGSKFVENFDGRLWFGWTGIGTEQNKNNIVYSGLDDLGDLPPENHIIIESDDGDYITGMAKFPGEYTDVPRQEMIVTKNNGIYKIVPASSGYNFWLIQSGVGCVSNSAISPAEGLLLFPDQHGVWAYDQNRVMDISLKIDPIFETWNFEELEKVSAVYDLQRRHYYLSYPDSSDTFNTKTIAFNIDHKGWSPESFVASAYCYQHSIFDSVKILFADVQSAYVYYYGTQADDIDDPVILTYQSPYLTFSPNPSFEYLMGFVTLEAFLDTGNVYLDWYTDYGVLKFQDTLICGENCYEEGQVSDAVLGKNISLKLTTGSEIDNFTLSQIWAEYIVIPNRR